MSTDLATLASFISQRREIVVGIPAADAAVIEPDLQVKGEPLRCVAVGVAIGVDSLVYLLAAPIQLFSPLRP